MKDCLKHQHVIARGVLCPDDPPMYRENEGLGLVLWVFGGILVGIALLIYVKGCSREPMPAVVNKSDCKCCHNRQTQMTALFKRAGSRSPEEMAYAVLQSKRNSRLLAAVAVVESGGNPKLRNTGYKKLHHGAFQVNPKYWHGNVPTSAAGQALQAESILEELVADQKAIIPALNYYGGESDKRNGKYAFNVLRELREVP